MPPVLAIHPGALGDVVLFGHLLRAVGGRATVVAHGERARLLAGLGSAERAMDFDSLPMHEVFGDCPAEECRLPRLLGPCERLISCFAAGVRSAEERLALLTGAGRADFLPVRPPSDFGGHLLDLWGRHLGIEIPREPAPWPVPPAWRDEAAGLLARVGVAADEGYWVIHPGAGAERKRWPLERFLEVIASAPRSLGRAVVVLGSVEEEQWGRRVREAAERAPTVLSPPLGALAGLLAGAQVFLGNDSGASHLAAAVGAPTLALFQRGEEARFAPRGRRVAVACAASLAELPVGLVRESLACLKG